MEVVQVLQMNGGSGDTSYANNSLLQRKAISMIKPIIEEAINAFYTTTIPQKFAIADLGCSSGPNTLFLVSELIKMTNNLCKRIGHKEPEYEIFLNDLPTNDFNTIFKSLPNFMDNLMVQMDDQMSQMFFMGVPGSFYNRLFPGKSLHFIHSSYALHWLSQVPSGLETNRRNICVATTSPPCIHKAYHEQFQNDFSKFLRYRAEELVSKGRMIVTFLGRRIEDPSSSKESCYSWELLGVALSEMVSEGLVREEDLNSFNIPLYTPSIKELESVVLKEGSFSIDHLEATGVDWHACGNEFDPCDALNDGGYRVAKCMRAVAEPMFVDHFGMEIIEDVFHRYKVLVADHMSKEKAEFINVTVSLIRKA